MCRPSTSEVPDPAVSACRRDGEGRRETRPAGAEMAARSLSALGVRHRIGRDRTVRLGVDGACTLVGVHQQVAEEGGGHVLSALSARFNYSLFTFSLILSKVYLSLVYFVLRVMALCHGYCLQVAFPGFIPPLNDIWGINYFECINSS